MKLGIIGAGTIVQEALPVLKMLPGLEIIAIQGRKESADKIEKICSANGIPNAVYDFESLCRLGIDAVYIALPNHLHFSYSINALRHGKHVIVEKPIASNLNEALRLKEMAQAKKLFLFEAVTTIYLDSYVKLQEWISEIGEIKLVQSSYSQYSRRYRAFKNGERLPVFDPARSGGAMMDLNLYNLHLVLGLFGLPDHMNYYANTEKGIDSSGVLIMEYPGFHAVCVAAKDSNGIVGTVIQGTNGCIRTEMPANIIGKVTLELNDGSIQTFDGGQPEDRLIPEFTIFIDAISKGDYEYCYKMLDKSITVSRIQTAARLSAGISFPSDDLTVE